MPQILVKKPLTYNGRDPILDEQTGKAQYKSSVMEDNSTVRKALASINDKKPPHLKLIIEPYKPEGKPEKNDKKSS